MKVIQFGILNHVGSERERETQTERVRGRTREREIYICICAHTSIYVNTMM